MEEYMTKTKSGFLKAGSILGIVFAALTAMLGLVFFVGQSIVTRDFVVPIVLECNPGEYETINNFDGSVTYKIVKDGNVEKVTTSEDVDAIIKLTKTTLATMGTLTLGISLATAALSIVVLNNTAAEKSKNGPIIALLVLSLLDCNLITFAFMIVALSMKDKPKAIEE